MIGNRTLSKIGWVDCESERWVERRRRWRYVIARWRIGGFAFIHCFESAKRGGCQNVFQAVRQLFPRDCQGQLTFLILHIARCNQTRNDIPKVI